MEPRRQTEQEHAAYVEGRNDGRRDEALSPYTDGQWDVYDVYDGEILVEIETDLVQLSAYFPVAEAEAFARAILKACGKEG